jgi:hypothetical protein
VANGPTRAETTHNPGVTREELEDEDMDDHTWLEEGETVSGHWSVTGEGQQTYGKIYVTNKYLRYNQQGSLGHVSEGTRKHLIHVQDKEFLAIPYNDILTVEIVKHLFIFKTLRVSLTSGDDLSFRFGVMSPEKAVDAINRHR